MFEFRAILVPRGRDPCGQHQGLRPLARPSQSDLCDLTMSL